MSYSWEKLRLVVACLAQAGPQRERLATAIVLHLVFLKPKDLPSMYRKDLTAITERICLRKMQSLRISVKERLAAINDKEIDSMINAILHMYDAVTRYQPISAIPIE